MSGDETTERSESEMSPKNANSDDGYGAYLREPLRAQRSPRFGEAHHKRVPTPMKKKRAGNIRFAEMKRIFSASAAGNGKLERVRKRTFPPRAVPFRPAAEEGKRPSLGRDGEK